MLDYLLLAEKKKPPSRISILEKLDCELAREKILVRLAHKMKALSENHYIRIEKKLLEIGRMIGGWIKYENGKRHSPPAKGNNSLFEEKDLETEKEAVATFS